MGQVEQGVKVYYENYAALPRRFSSKIDADLDYILKAGLPGLQKVYLFGSCARGDLKNSSDVDLLIVTADKLSDRELAADVRWTLEESLDGVSTDVVFTHRGALDSSSTFSRVVERDRKLILEVLL